MVDGERLDCPLCTKTYKNNNQGRGYLKRHAKVHLSLSEVRVRSFMRVEVYYACPFPDCDYKARNSQGLWMHFYRHDHFGLLIKKVKRKGI